ncbi:uncharacterized protein VTP21DRAFT_6343 [Calcarisporiella thermophila]|uniref:uncharacterized protein n=1 Tax=Calcarisporiella thermophila TaxID=911321 RepID=UPI0037423AF4
MARLFYLACLLGAVSAVDLSRFRIKRDGEGDVTAAVQDAVNTLLNKETPLLVWPRLTELTDLFGHRITGSESLERALQYIETVAKTDNLTVISEPVSVTYWKRGQESLSLVSQQNTRGGDLKLPVIGLGNTTTTPKEGFTAPVVVVHNEEEFNATEVKDSIVLWNVPFTTYGETVRFRRRGRVLGELKGSKAMLIRSVTPFSLNTLHTGTSGGEGVPAAAVTIETAEFLDRMYTRWKNAANSTSPYANEFKQPVVKLLLENERQPKQSRNILVEIKGRELPDEVVILGGHIDSWDVGAGAMDDGAGAFIGWEAVRLISKLPRPPKRTIRTVFWMDEEQGGSGSDAYLAARKKDNTLSKHVFAIESDEGVFRPFGLSYKVTKNETGPLEKLQELSSKYLGQRDGTEVISGGAAADIENLCDNGVPCAAWMSYDALKRNVRPDQPLEYNSYFYYHHTDADTPEALNRTDVEESARVLAAWAYVIAEEGVGAVPQAQNQTQA